MRTNCTLPGPSPRRRPLKRFPRAEHFDSFAELITVTREAHHLSVRDIATLTNTKPHLVSRFESGRSLPHTYFLRGLRDALELPLAWFEHCVDHFTWPNASEDLQNSPVEEEFVRLAGTLIGSSEETKQVNQLWVKYLYIPEAAARRIVFKPSDREDFAQEAQIALQSAVLMHLPYLGGFKSYAWKWCEGTIRGKLSELYYGKTPEALKKQHSVVLKAIRAYQAKHGHRPSTSFLVSATGLTWAEVMDSERFHHLRQHEVSLEEPRGNSDGTYGDLI